MVVKEWKCAEHGSFECSDAICPNPGCLSESVEREFRTAPSLRTGMVRQHDAGIRGLSDRMGGANFRSAQHEGDTAYGGHLANGMYWGRDAAKFLGHDITMNTQATDAMKSDAAVATRKDFVHHDMRPPVDTITVHGSDKIDQRKVQAP